MKLFKLTLVLILFNSCQTSIFVKGQKEEQYNIRIWLTNQNSTTEIIYVRAKGLDNENQYIFNKSYINKIEHKNNKQLPRNIRHQVYKSVFDNTFTSSLTHIDSIVFKLVTNTADSLKIKELDFVKNVTGFKL